MKDDTSEKEKRRSLAEMVIEFLKQNPGYEYTAVRIAEWISVNKLDWCAKKRLRSKVNLDSDEKLITQVAKEIPSQRFSIQKKDPKININRVGKSLEYCYTDKSDVKKSDSAEGKPQTPASSGKSDKTNKREEETLYPVLGKFLRKELKICSKRLHHQTSFGNVEPGTTDWLHPDLVGLQNLSEGWIPEIKDCVVETRADKRGNLWSFEVKWEVTKISMRKDFFQAVSVRAWMIIKL